MVSASGSPGSVRSPTQATCPRSRWGMRRPSSGFINGQTGTDNVQRQGENAPILDNESPLNILEDVPNDGGQFNYSPMWDIHFLRWNASVPVANRLRQTDFARAAALVPAKAQSIAPDGNPSNTFQATGFIVNCPRISIFANA